MERLTTAGWQRCWLQALPVEPATPICKKGLGSSGPMSVGSCWSSRFPDPFAFTKRFATGSGSPFKFASRLSA